MTKIEILVSEYIFKRSINARSGILMLIKCIITKTNVFNNEI